MHSPAVIHVKHISPLLKRMSARECFFLVVPINYQPIIQFPENYHLGVYYVPFRVFPGYGHWLLCNVIILTAILGVGLISKIIFPLFPPILRY